MNRRSVAALLVTPVVAGVIPTFSYLLSGSTQEVGASQWIQVAAWVVFAVAFEVIVLVPMASLLRGWKHFRLCLLSAGSIAWLLLSFAWFVAVFRVSATEALAPAALMGLAGVAICGSFVVLWVRTSTNHLPSGGGDA
jgi:hypothetical protein